MDKNSPAAELEHFLNFVEACSQEYKIAYDKVNEEDRSLESDAAAPGATTERGRIPIRGTGIQAKSKGA